MEARSSWQSSMRTWCPCGRLKLMKRLISNIHNSVWQIDVLPVGNPHHLVRSVFCFTLDYRPQSTGKVSDRDEPATPETSFFFFSHTCFCFLIILGDCQVVVLLNVHQQVPATRHLDKLFRHQLVEAFEWTNLFGGPGTKIRGDMIDLSVDQVLNVAKYKRWNIDLASGHLKT